MINVVPWNHKYPLAGAAVSTFSSTLSVINCSARSPLQDFKPYNELYSLKIIGNSTLQAATVAFLPALNNFQAFIAEGNDPDDYDWGKNLKPLVPNVLPSFGKVYGIQCIKKMFQYYCINSFDALVADQFIRDIALSATRKLNRYGRSLLFLTDTFAMALQADALYRLSVLTFETGMDFYRWASDKKRQVDVVVTTKRVSKKALKLFMGSIAVSFGFAIGSLVDQKYLLSALLGTASELMMSAACDALLGV